MVPTSARFIGRPLGALTTVCALVAGLLVVSFGVGPAPKAAAATVTIGTISAQMANQVGTDNGTNGNCITYAPPGTSSSSALVTSPNEAQTAHGRPGQSASSCPSTLSTTNQSAIGFRPSAVTSAADSTPFLIGRMIHYNNPVYTNDEYFNGDLRTVLGGFTTPNTLTFNWTMDETPNTGVGNCCNDTITFNNQISDVTLTQGGQTYKLVVLGFVPVANGTACPAAPAGTPQNMFSTVENTQTHACLYAELVQLRSLRVVKTVTGSPPGSPSFSFTSTSALAGSPWAAASFSLVNGGSKQADLTTGDTVSVTEADPGDDRWSLTGLACTQYAANGASQVAVPGVTYNMASRQVTLANVPSPLYAGNPLITCTFTNAYTSKTTLTLVKQVQGNVVSPALWTLSATGTGGATAGVTISGPAGSAAVTNQRIAAGSYQLAEVGTGAAQNGFVQVGNWVCAAGGSSYPVTTGGLVTLPDLPAGTAVTCTVVNRQAVGSLQISKLVDDPVGGYVGGTGKTFSGTYNCGPGYLGTFTTLTTASPVTIDNLPAGASCTVAETTPTGGLLNGSFAWGAPTTSTQPVTIVDQATATVTITNHVVQNFGTFALTKVISGPGGYTGGPNRVFPVAYSCTLTNGPTTSGTLNLTTASSVSPASAIPTGSVCTFAETLTAQPGDFSDPSYVWVPPAAITPSSVTIGNGTTSAVTVTNTYARQFGQLIIAKVVQGDGYVGTGAPFVVDYDCGVLSGKVNLADGGRQAITVPAGNACTVVEEKPSPDLLDAAHVWGTATWSPANTAVILPNGSTTLTVTNPTIAVFGQVRVIKVVTGETQGVTAAASFGIHLVCDNGGAYDFTVGAGGSASTPDLPVGTSCTVTETPASGGLVDPSYAWGPTSITPSTVTVTAPNQVVSATVTNTVIRVRGSLVIAKRLVAPAGVVDPGRTFAIDYSCVYGNDTPVAGSVTLAAGGSETVDGLLLGSRCTVAEQPGTLTTPPSSSDPSYVWLPVTYSPGSVVTVSSDQTPVGVTVTNSVDRLEGTFQLTKAVVGPGKEGGYTEGAQFTFHVTCSNGLDEIVQLADGESWRPTGDIPIGSSCTIEETGKPPTPPQYGWDAVQWSIGTTRADGSMTFVITDPDVPLQVNAINPITPRFGSVRLTKTVTGATSGLVDGTSFRVNLNCGAGLVYQLTLTVGVGVTQGTIPAGSTCVATEVPPGQSSLVDDSYAWGTTSYVPGNATVTVVVDEIADIAVENPIVRVTAPVRLVKTVAGGEGVVDPGRTYPVSWSCDYRGTTVASGTVLATADPAGVQLAADVPVTSVCTAEERVEDLGAPSTDPAYRWETPTISPTTVTQAGPNVVTVANTLTRDSGQVLVRKRVTGATDGYLHLGDPDALDFTLHGSCSVAADPSIPTRYADGSIADGGEVPIVASIGWTCSGSEDTPLQSLLKDSSYAWGTPILTWGPASDIAPPAPTVDNTGPFVLTRDDPTIAFWAVNPIVRVSSTFTITKRVVDPFGVVDPGTLYTGHFSCVYGSDEPVTGTWSVSNGSTFTGPSVYLNSVCTVTENPLGITGLPDGSYAWSQQIGDPVTVVTGGTAHVDVTNTVYRLYGGLQISKVLHDPDGGVIPGSTFGGVWSCASGSLTYSDRFSVGPNAAVTAFTATDERVPAGAICAITEDTPDPDALVDGSFGWDQPTYSPDDVTLQAGSSVELTVTNSVHRVYSAVQVDKVISGPAAGLVPVDRAFTGSLTCRYGSDDPVVSTWAASAATAWVKDGILVGSVCSATEDAPGAGGQPVAGDPSYAWLAPQVGEPVTVTPPTVANPVITVTNPTARIFGQFFLSKAVTGHTEGVVDRPAATYPMTYSCLPGTGDPITGTVALSEGETVTVGPGLEIPVEIPVGAVCTLTEPSDSMPPLVDDAWSWAEPTFALAGLSGDLEPVTESCGDPVVPPCLGDRSITVTVPPPQENQPIPTIGLAITNHVDRAYGSFTIEKSSDPVSGTVVAPGQAITYSVVVHSTGEVPVHDVVVTDDLSSVLPYGTVEPVSAPDGTTASLDPQARTLTWTVGTLPAGQSLTLTYRLVIGAGMTGVTIRNAVTGTGDVPPSTCAAGDDPGCSTNHRTPLPPTVTKSADGTPTWDPATGAWTVGYRIVVTNPNGDAAVPYDLTDQLGYPSGVTVDSASVVSAPDGVALADPAWNGTDHTAVVTDATLPAGESHSYLVRVRATVPPELTGSALTCASGGSGSGQGFFNAATVTAFGSSSTAEQCQPIPVLLVVAKNWVIGGVTYPDGSQPAAYHATLTLDGSEQSWGTTYGGFAVGTVVHVGEAVTLPTACSSTSSGTGGVRLDQQLTSVTVTNVIDCISPPPPNPLPDTGFPLLSHLEWGLALLLAGAGLLFIGVRRRERRS